MNQLKITLKTLKDTQKLGSVLGNVLTSGDIVRLQGSLGAGKTELARALIQDICGPVEVPSPTFTLVETYEGPHFPIWHFDLYRLNTPEEIWELGFEDAIEGGVCLIEWPQKAGNLVPPEALTVEMIVDGGNRTVAFAGNDKWHQQLVMIEEAFRESP